MKRYLFLCLLLCIAFGVSADEAFSALMERLSPGLSRKINVQLVPDTTADFFEITASDGKPLLRANSRVTAGAALHRYLRDYLGVHLSWGNMRAPALPDSLPLPSEAVRCETPLKMRYYLNYCTHSYSMAFWDWRRWEQEIDWMALHGINMPLAITGSEAVWRGTLRRLGYDDASIDRFIAGPAYQAWWLMNNLEGWGGPVSDSYIDRQGELQRKILSRMRSLDMHPVLPGYSGMLPHDAASRLGVHVADPGKWLGFTRPAFLQPTDTAFARIAGMYYDELHKLYGTSRYYSMDPFHEGGSTDGVDLAEAALAIERAMTQASPGSVWVVQGWQANPSPLMLDALAPGRMAVLDLQAENQPGWETRHDGFGRQPWLFCMLLNFGGNEGLYGKLPALVQRFRKARHESPTLSGTGLTMEGIGNNPVMYEYFTDLPWLTDRELADTDAWLKEYCRTRYGGRRDPRIERAWLLLGHSIYNSPADSVQQGATESVFCARPADKVTDVSTWASSRRYYSPDSVILAARLLCEAADSFCGNPNFIHDLVDVARQAVAEQGRRVSDRIALSAERNDREAYATNAARFLDLIMIQDSLLALVPEFRLDTHIAEARAHGLTPEEKNLMERNLRTQITVWGHREAAEKGGLRDYSHREWSGLLRGFYYPRWKRWFDMRLAEWDSHRKPEIDFFAMDEAFTRQVSDGTMPSPAPDGLDGKGIVKEVRRLLSRAL